MRGLAVIPARGGSKRLPGKNVRLFHGRPIMAYSIECALRAGCFDEVMVSTDDETIARVALECGARVPFRRSEVTADDYSTTDDVVAEVLDAYERMGERFDVIACLYATAPLMRAEHLLTGVRSVQSGECDAAFAMVRYSYPVQRALVVRDGFTVMQHPEHALSRSQDLEPVYHDAGQFYVASVQAFREYGGFWGPRTRGIELSELEVQDVDSATDWALAELKYTLLHASGTN